MRRESTACALLRSGKPLAVKGWLGEVCVELASVGFLASFKPPRGAGETRRFSDPGPALSWAHQRARGTLPVLRG